MAQSDAVAAEVMGRAYGEPGALVVSLCIAVSALTSANATVFTGARTLYARGRISAAGVPRTLEWAAGTPTGALVVQGAVALLLVLSGC